MEPCLSSTRLNVHTFVSQCKLYCAQIQSRLLISCFESCTTIVGLQIKFGVSISALAGHQTFEARVILDA